MLSLPAEIAPRYALVHAAKRALAARGLPPELTPAELDALLPPANCRRTRDRLRRPPGAPRARNRALGASGLRGVRLQPNGRYAGQLYHRGRLLFCGTHATAQEAAGAVEAKRKELEDSR